MTFNPARRGMYFEEFEEGQQIVTTSRTITETDIVNFAGLSGDYNQIHIDAEYVKNTPFKQRIAHGLLVTSIASGLAVQTGFMEGTVIAFREISNWKFSQTVFIGDTVHAEITVVETKALRRLGGGAVAAKVSVINQNGVTVITGTWTFLMASEPQAE